MRFSRSPVYSRNGMVSCSQPLASEAGHGILKAGGNAVDAAIAMAAALSVTEPASTGLGGDCFLLFYEAKTKKIHALNGSGKSAKGITLETALKDSQNGVLAPCHAVTTPGTAAGWCDAIEAWGTLPMSEILAPAVKLAEEGFPVSPITAHAWGHGEKLLRRTKNFSELMVPGPDGSYHTPKAGEVFKNPTLANVLRELGEHGKEQFYTGRVGKAIVDIVQELGGKLDLSDLKEHKSKFLEPICTRFRGVDVYEVPPNGQGITALIALNLLSNSQADIGNEHSSPQHLHLLIEAMRLAFADTRALVADPECVKVPISELMSEEYAATRSKLINPSKATANVECGMPLSTCDTVSFQVVDPLGNAVSMVNSIYGDTFGTGFVPEGCGFSLQNRGDNFSLEEGHPNVIAPQKRPYHTIIPAIVLYPNKELFSTFTVMGGFMQPQGHVQVLVNMLHFNMNPQEALDAPRFCIADGRGNGKVSFEEGISEETIAALEKLGHRVVTSPVTGFDRSLFGRGQIILRNPTTGVLTAGSDGRGDGCAIGF